MLVPTLISTLVAVQAVSSSPVPAPTGYIPTAQTFWWDDVYPPIGHLATLSHHHLADRAQYKNLIAYPSAGKGGYWVQDYPGMLRLSPGQMMPHNGGNLTAVHRYGEDTAVMRLPEGFTENRIQFRFLPPVSVIVEGRCTAADARSPGKDNVLFIVSDQCPGAPHDTVAACKSKSSRGLTDV